MRAFVFLVATAAALRLPAPHTRREIMQSSIAAGLASIAAPALATGNMPAVQGTVGKMDGSVKAASTPEAAKKQIAAGYVELGRLFDNYEAVSSSGGGDGVRRVLGTVGTDSPLYLVEKAFRLLFESDETLPMEYIEKVESLMQNLASAETEAYSAIFIEFSSAKGKPEDYFKRSKVAVGRARDDWKALMDYLKM